MTKFGVAKFAPLRRAGIYIGKAESSHPCECSSCNVPEWDVVNLTSQVNPGPTLKAGARRFEQR